MDIKSIALAIVLTPITIGLCIAMLVASYMLIGVATVALVATGIYFLIRERK